MRPSPPLLQRLPRALRVLALVPFAALAPLACDLRARGASPEGAPISREPLLPVAPGSPAPLPLVTALSSATAPPSAPSAAPSSRAAARDTAAPGLPALCDPGGDTRLLPPARCDRRRGRTSSEIPANGRYAASSFGCRFKADGTLHKDPDDNCEFACKPRGLCDPRWDGPTCQANLKWFAADADRYGCGARIRVTHCESGKSVVLVTLDRGPSCKSVEQKYGVSILDMSRDAMTYLFDGETHGGVDRKAVVVERVDERTPLGPTGRAPASP